MLGTELLQTEDLCLYRVINFSALSICWTLEQYSNQHYHLNTQISQEKTSLDCPPVESVVLLDPSEGGGGRALPLTSWCSDCWRLWETLLTSLVLEWVEEF